MKPTIHATIIFAGFFVAAGTAAIITTEYQVVSTKGAAVVSLLRDFRAADRNASGSMVAQRFELSRDGDPFGADVRARLQSEVAQNSGMAPVVDVRAVALPRLAETSRRTHSHSARSECKTEPAAVLPKPLRAIEASRAVKPTLASQPLTPVKPVESLVAYNVQGTPKRLVLPKGFRFYYRTGHGATISLRGQNGQSEQDAVKLEMDQKLLALQQKALSENLKTIPSGVTAAFIQIHPEDFAKFKEIGSKKNVTEVELRGAEQAMTSAHEIAAAQMERAFETATNQIQISSSMDTGN